ncbi:MAG: radical SAM protein, partial [Planctomycetota bacterium]
MRLLNLQRLEQVNSRSEGRGKWPRGLPLSTSSLAPAPASSRRGNAREIRFGDARVFLDPGTLSAWAAEGPDEHAPVSSGLEREFPPPAGSKVRAVVLSVTHGCNLACRYCYVRKHLSASVRSAGGDGPTMSLETARKALALLEPPGPWRVGFFGGEPLLVWDLVREVTELARERADRFGARVRFSVTTNGTLLDEARARFLAERGFSLIVSLDGPQELHDRERITALPQRSQRAQRRKDAKEVSSSVNSVPSVASRCGNGSFEQVQRGLDAAAAAGLGARTTLRATFPLARPALAERLEFLNGLADSGLARAVSVEPAWPAPSDISDIREGVQLGALPGEYLAAARWAVARLEAGKRVRYHHLEKAL